jgi:transposase
MRKISEVLRQRHELKRNYRDIARSLNISISTVSNYLWRAKVAGITWPLGQLSEEELYDKLFSEAENASKKPLPDWAQVHQELRKKGVTLQLLWREYRDCHPEGVGYTWFCILYREHTKAISPVMRQVHKAGEKIFVDYAGMKMPWLNIVTGEINEAEIFVGALGASQFTFAEATESQSLPNWIQSHIHMFESFGGVSKVVVPDNLKAGVTKAHNYDPDINVNYQLFSEHYGFAIVPARVAQAKDKAKVENAVGCVERQILAPLRHLTFTSIAEINAAIKPRVANFNTQLFQKMKTSRCELFETIDKPALNPLPSTRYEFADWINAKVNIDYHFVFDNHYYSVPYKYIHQQVQIRATHQTVECFFKEKRIAVHARSFIKYKFTTLKEHMPAAHRAHAEWGPERIKRWAKKIGPQTNQFIEYLISSRPFPQQAYRSCLGLLRLAQRYSEVRLEKACAIALTVGATRYQQIESILKNRLDNKDVSHKQDEIIVSKHINIRGSKYYK